MLSSWGVAVDAVDVAASPAARAELEALGIPLLPAVVAAGGAVHGWNPEALATLLSVAYVPPPRLSPLELARRLDRVLDGAVRALGQVPAARLDDVPTAGRERSLRQLGYHVFRLSVALPDGLATGRLPARWLQETVPPDLRAPDRLLRYGARVRALVRAALAGPIGWAEVIATDSGPQTGHELLERTTWHAAQHLRQLYAYLAAAGIAPRDPLGQADWAGLPLPRDP